MATRDSKEPTAKRGRVEGASGGDPNRFSRRLLAVLGFIVRMMFFRHPEALR
ncbi:hypothetical protein [Paenibacillus sp. BC26]|uniref:hypothetical protein n=1 Tax=Paenibacillus sp. BC26 TaxID=1881032 RepID=UPI0008F3A265|nr:hypothetical protein [Paenibacillus sp. BC26]SFT28526.1 hypothetical protein SAMN05428962_6368 [Paenibacillus sp. BC26]